LRKSSPGFDLNREGQMRILSLREAWRRAGDMSKTSDWRHRQKDPTYPTRVQVSPGKLGYVESEWDAWLAARPRVQVRQPERLRRPERPEPQPEHRGRRVRKVDHKLPVGAGPWWRYRDGESITTIAARLGCSPNTVAQLLEERSAGSQGGRGGRLERGA
jgi:predicted DNA-binding transcriptional regulator AlpA